MSDDKDYAHMRDPEAQRTRFELWAIVVIVVVVVAGALIWRVVEHKPAGHQRGWPEKGQVNSTYPEGAEPAAAAGVQSPPPRPIAP